jgi:hypothetical protein
MTDEERQKLCSTLRSMYADWWCDCDRETCDAAADEIERLMKEKEDLRSAFCNYLRQAEAGLDELKANLREDAWWWLNPIPTK